MTKTETLRGEFTAQSLPALVQYLAQCSLTGELRLKYPQGNAILYLDRGKLVDALHNNKEGQEAFFEVMELPQGTFSFCVGDSVLGSKITDTLEKLLLDAAYWQDTKPRFVLSGASVPKLLLDQIQGSIQLSADEIRLTTRINGQRTLEFIAGILNLELSAVCHTVQGLLEKGLVEIREKPKPIQIVKKIHPAFAHALLPLLTRLVGPMAEYKIQDVLEEYRLSALTDLEQAQLPVFLQNLASKLHPSKQAQFLTQAKALREQHEK